MQQKQLFSYIVEHDGEEIDYAFISKNMGMSYRQIYRGLLELDREGIIVAEQKDLRTPILITDSDYQNYYWKVYVNTDEQEQSMVDFTASV